MAVQRRALQPGAEAGRGEQVVEGERQFVARFGGIDLGDGQDADLCHRRVLDFADELGEVEVTSGVPMVFQDVGEVELRRAGAVARFANEGEQGGGGAVEVVGVGFAFALDGGVGRAKVGKERERQAVFAAGGVDVDGIGGSERFLSRGTLLAGVDALAPFLCGGGRPCVGGLAALGEARGVGVGGKVGGAARGEVEGEVAEVAFGVDGDDGDAVQRGFFEQGDAEAGFAGAGHADDDGVGGEVGSVVEDGRAGVGQGFGAEVELADVFGDGGHGVSGVSRGRRSRRSAAVL